MSHQDDIIQIRRQLADIILRLNSIRAIAGAHDLLSSIHGDTLAAAVQAGDMIFANATPAWARKAKANNGDIWTLAAGLPGWQNPGVVVTEDGIQYWDEFADASRHWSWFDSGTSGAVKTIVESGSVLTIATAAGTNSDWWTGTNNNQKAIIGIPGFPCEIITKLNSYVVNDQTAAGLFIARTPTVGAPAADSATYIMRVRDVGAGLNGYGVQNLGGAVWAYAATTTLPVWFRIRIGFDSFQQVKGDFSYSTDGIAYTVLYTSVSSPAGGGSYPVVAGLFVKTYGALNAISAPFEFFQMKRSKGPG